MIRLNSMSCVWVLCYACVLCAHPGAHHDIERISKLIESSPEQADLWIERAHHRRLAGEYDGALLDLKEAERLSPGNWDVIAHRGLTLALMGRGQEAEAALDRFLNNTPGSAITFVERARIRQASGRTELAISDLTASLAQSRDIEIYLERGRLQEALKRWDDAAAGYTEGLTFFGPIGSLQRSMVRVELARGNQDKALSLIDAAMAKTRSKAPWRLQRALVLESAGDTEAAHKERIAALDETNRILSKRITAIQLVQRAQVYLSLNRRADARRDLELAIEKSPRYGAALELKSKLNQ